MERLQNFMPLDARIVLTANAGQFSFPASWHAAVERLVRGSAVRRRSHPPPPAPELTVRGGAPYIKLGLLRQSKRTPRARERRVRTMREAKAFAWNFRARDAMSVSKFSLGSTQNAPCAGALGAHDARSKGLRLEFPCAGRHVGVKVLVRLNTERPVRGSAGCARCAKRKPSPGISVRGTPCRYQSSRQAQHRTPRARERRVPDGLERRFSRQNFPYAREYPHT